MRCMHTFRPSCPALMAATYPATPPPMMTRSFSSVSVAYPLRNLVCRRDVDVLSLNRRAARNGARGTLESMVAPRYEREGVVE